MAGLNEWKDSIMLQRVQDPSLLVNGLFAMAEKYSLYNGMIPSTDSQGYSYLEPENRLFRIPGIMKSVQYQMTSVSDLGVQGVRRFNFFLGDGIWTVSDFSSKTEILDYVPRLFVRLTKFSEFYDNYLATNGYTTHYKADVKFNDYETGNYGYLYDNVLLSDLYYNENAYVLTAYSIYTNKTDGTEQTLVKSYDYSATSTSSIDIYDMYVPCAGKGTISGAESKTGYIAYMHSLIARKHYTSPVGNAAQWIGRIPMYVGHGGDIFTDKIKGAVNMFSVTSDTPFSPVPFMAATNVGWDKWTVLTSAPYGRSVNAIYYTVADLKTWKTLITASGMPWSDKLEDVTKPEDDDLNKPTEPGQPDNPEDDDDGDGDNISDDIEYPMPGYVPSAYTRYWLRPTDLPDLKDFLFSQTFLDDIKRLWTNPGEYIVDCTFYPLIADSLGLSGQLEEIVVGNMNSGISGYVYPDGVSAYHYGGGFKVEPYYGSYLDYEPYTTISIYIPYIGVRPLNASRITGHTLKLAYTFDFGTRQITAHLGLDGDMTLDGGDLGNALDQYTGSFGVSFPFSGSQNNQMVLNILQQSSKVISSAGAIAGGIATGNIANVAAGVYGMTTTSGHLTAETYGSLTPTAGLYSPQIPYLIINRPITAEPKDYRAREGYSAAYSGKVSGFSGFLKCATAEVPQSGTMTDSECKEIVRLLKEGVYL